MAEQFYTILSNVGKAAIANASALGNKVDFKYMALGDGDGSYYEPTENQNALKNEVFRGQIKNISINEENPNWIKLTMSIPPQEGGFTIRELGVISTSGELLAVGKYPETYKPTIDNGSSKDLTINMVIEVANSDVVTLKIDPTVILATKKELDTHKGANMPHIFRNLQRGKTYRYGYQVSSQGVPQVISEEVIEQ